MYTHTCILPTIKWLLHSPIMSVEDPVVERSRMERRLAHNVNMSILQSMYIMAEFHHTEEAGSVEI